MNRPVCRIGLLLTIVAIAASVVLSTARSAPARPRDALSPELAECKRLRIERVEVDNQNIFNEDEETDIGGFSYSWINFLHNVTDGDVIRDGLLFGPGDEIPPTYIEDSERSLRDLGIFRDVWILTEPAGICTVNVFVVTQDSWTLQVAGTFGREGGEPQTEFRLAEKNFMGRAKTVIYRRKDTPDESTNLFVYGDPNLGRTRFKLDLAYSVGLDSRVYRLYARRPFYSALDPFSVEALIEDIDDELTFYHRGEEDRTYIRNLLAYRVGYAGFGGKTGHWIGRAGVQYHYRDKQLRPVLPAGQAPPYYPFAVYEETVSERIFGIYWRLFTNEYTKERFINKFERTEDFYIGKSVRFDVGYSPEELGATRTRLYLSTRLNRGLVWAPGHFTLLEFEGGLRYGEERFENVQSRILLNHFLRILELRQTFVVSAQVRWGERLDQDQQFELGAEQGLRGYPAHFLQGDRLFLLNLEDRIWLFTDVLHLFSLGAVVFADTGTAFWHGHMRRDDWKTDAGLGLSISITRAAVAPPIRIDLSYAFNTAPGQSFDFNRFFISIGADFEKIEVE